MKITFLICIFSISIISLKANRDSSHTHIKDTFNLAQHFSRGHVSGHFRNFFMNTINEGSLRDYWTNAFGMSLHYESLAFKGFMFEMKGIFTFQTFSSDLNYKDPITGLTSKWEHELYDVLDPENRTDLDRLEELFIHYQWKNSFIRYGRIPINKTPLINQRDERMKPFAFEGLYNEIEFTKRWKSKSIIIHGVSPRSTVEWFQLNDAIGLYDNGFSVNGNQSNYLGLLNSNYLIAQEINYKTEKTDFSLWNFYMDKLFNLNWLQLEINHNSWKLGLIGVHQFGLNDQSALTQENQYIAPKKSVNIVSSILERKSKTTAISLSRTDIFGDGRFVFPRELGREDLYTSLVRSRFEGLGKSQSTNFSLTYFPKQKENLEIDIIGSYVQAPPTIDFAHNKYGVRDYFHTIFRVDYNFIGKLKGLELDFIYIYHKDVDTEPLTQQEAFNKTNFHQINLIMNVNF